MYTVRSFNDFKILSHGDVIEQPENVLTDDSDKTSIIKIQLNSWSRLQLTKWEKKPKWCTSDSIDFGHMLICEFS